MRRANMIVVFISLFVVLVIVAAVSFGTAQQEPVGDVSAPAQLNVGEHTVEEIETERLVCAVAWSDLGHNVAISCVPNIPGMFEETVR